MSSRGGTATATADEGVVITPVDVDVDRCTASGSDGDGATAIAAASSVAAATNVIKHSNSLSPLGDASGVAILLGNHAEFGLAERCCYHFDLMENLTAIPSKTVQQAISRRKERGQSISLSDAGASMNNSDGNIACKDGDTEGKVKDAKAISKVKSSSKLKGEATNQCVCGVVSLLECVAGGSGAQDRTTKRTLRSKHREFNTRAQFAWGRNARGTISGALKRQGKLGNVSTPRRCHQPSHLPLALNPNTRVAFAYELTSIAILLDASPSLTSTIGLQYTGFGELHKPSMKDECCVPLDRLGPLIKTYLLGLVQPIEVPPVSVSGLGIAFGKWRPNLAVTVVAVYPPTSKMDCASAGLLVRDFRVTDETSAQELASQIDRWALREVESVIGERLCRENIRPGFGGSWSNIGNKQYLPTMSPLGSFSLPVHRTRVNHVRSYVRDILAVGDAALSTLPPEGRPLILVATDCHNVHCGGGIELLSETARVDVPISVLNLSQKSGSSQSEFPLYLSVSDDSQSLQDLCHLSGGIFLESSSLEEYIETRAGSPTTPSSTFKGDFHFISKKRSIKPNALQWYTIFTLSPYTSRGSLCPSRVISAPESGSFNISSSTMSSSRSCASFAALNPAASSTLNSGARPNSSGVETTLSRERIVLARYSIQPIRIKSLLMTRVVEGYRARRYGYNMQDNDKVSVDFALPLLDWGVILHYEVSFVSSPYHIPTVGQAHVKLELSGDDAEFLQTIKKLFSSNHGSESAVMRGGRISNSSKVAADKICKLLRWTRKEDHLESYLCSPGWGGIGHFDKRSTFLGRLETLSKLQRFRHFRSLTFDVVTIAPSCYENSAHNLFGDVMGPNEGEGELFLALSNWSSGIISDRASYFKVINSAQDDDLAYYCIIRVIHSSNVSRLFTLVVDFHGEFNVELRSAIMVSLKEALQGCAHVLVLQKCISNYVCFRPDIADSSPCWSEFFVHHKRWKLCQDAEVLPLVTKRRTEVENFFLLHSDSRRGVFAKLLHADMSAGNDQILARNSMDVAVYQVLIRADGIYVEFYMEACHSTFHPFHVKHFGTLFNKLFETVKSKDVDCSRNIHSRSNLLAALNQDHALPASSIYHGTSTEDVSRFIRTSTRTSTKLRFFNTTGSGSANKLLEWLTIRHLTSEACPTKSTRLCIDESTPILNLSGTWLIMQIDRNILSVVCLENHDQTLSEAESSQSYRPLSFFTAGINDMYPSDDELEVDRIGCDSEACEVHFGVSNIAKVIQFEHAKHYARVCYWALRDKVNPITSLQSEDVEYALSTLSFRKSLSTFVSVRDLSASSKHNVQTDAGERLWTVICTLLRIVPGSDDLLFFYIGDDNTVSDERPLISSHPYGANRSLDDSRGVNGESEFQSNNETGLDNALPNFDHPPLFFRFTIDGESANLNDILKLDKNATVAAEVSIHSESEDDILPQPHVSAVSKLHNAFSSFAAEQKLEHYRSIGRSLTEEMCREIMLNLPKTQHKSCEMALEFFSSKSDSLVSARDSAGNNENGYKILFNEFERSTFIRVGHDTFLAYESTMMDEFPYWCFVQIWKPTGNIVIQVHHPLGEASSEEQLQLTQGLVKGICDRTNQRLLLDSLFRTKSASSLLIRKEEGEKEDMLDAGSETKLVSSYFCPVQHTATIPVHRRCAPQQAVLALETTILQNFIVSNRRGVFVYKDELENIFYMQLRWFRVADAKDSDRSPHMIELVVYGCDEPGPSITDHLVCLLKKKLLTLTLDALSSLLKKNPWFNLLATDLAFIKDFSSELRALDREKIPPPQDCIRTYLLPTNVLDPLMLLLMLRQNICGSTFFQRLHHEGISADLKSEADQVAETDGEITIHLTKMPEFQFYFNSSPSQLDPHYQTGATLTERGAQYSRQAGSGIAIVEMSLQYGNETQCDIQFGKRADFMNEQLRVSQSDLSLSECSDCSQNDHRFKVNVEVINTTVNMDVIHKWVELSLSQVLVAWSIERHLDAARMGILRHIGAETTEYNSICELTEQSKLDSINRTITGLQALQDMILIASDLPHPAIARVECRGMLRATVLANLTLEVMETILSTIIPKTKSCGGVDIIRYNSLEGASKVNIRKDNYPSSSARVELLGNGTEVKDQPTSSPEYIVVFGLNSESHTSSINSPQNMFFKHAFSGIEQDTFSFSQAISKIKNAKPSLFQRHLVFIVKISRGSRTLMTYNAHPQLRARLESRFKEIDQAVAKSEHQYISSLQKRCLHHISFLPATSSQKATTPTEPGVAKMKESNEKKPENESLKSESMGKSEPTKRIPRPTTMLRPKLIGKSIEGSAMQAVAARRLKASSGPVALQRTVSGSGKKSITTVAAAPRGGEKASIDKPVSVERIVSGSGPAALPMLKSIMTTYCAEFQAQLTSPGYRLQRRFLSPSTFLEGTILDSCKKQTLMKHFRSNCKIYNLTCSGTGDETCFSGKLDIAGVTVHYFISWHETVEDAFDIFILCATNGKNIDGYITKDGSLYAERTLDVISSSAMAAVRGNIESASKTIRNLHIWKFFVRGVASQSTLSREILVENLIELRKCSYQVDLVSVDPRLTAILQDTSNELRLSWPSVFNAISKSPVFSHHTVIESGDTITHLVYYKEEEVFLDLIVCQQQHQQQQQQPGAEVVEAARILAKEQFPDVNVSNSETKEATTAVNSAVQKFVMFLLQWLWNDCENKLDCK